MSVEVLHIRGSCHVQDGGRLGQSHLGIPVGGFADRTSATSANLLVGKPAHAPLLECTVGGPTLYFLVPTVLVITGADISPQLDGRDIPLWQTVKVSKGSMLTCKNAKGGVRSYIAFSSPFSIDTWRQSASPLQLGESIYPPQSMLQEGQKLIFSATDQKPFIRIASTYANVPRHLKDLASGRPILLRLHAAPETPILQEASDVVGKFLDTAWEVSPMSNRMGIRLLGASLPIDKANGFMRSAPVLPGTVQLLPDGNLIVTHVDSPTIGGYPRIGILDSYGIRVLAQAVPGKTKLRLRM